MYKEFQKDDFDKFDEAARTKAKNFWISQGYSCEDNPDEYAVDLICSKDDTKFYCEVEVKRPWHGVAFKFDSLHIPLRKKKFLDKPMQFMVFNNSLTHAAVVSRKTVLASPTVEVSNVKIRHGERFFNIPKDKLIFVTTL